jgi:osmotically-inducible protein OsmY
MGQGKRKKSPSGALMRLFLGAVFSLLLIENSWGQVNPFSVLGRVVTTAMDARSKAEVTADTEISAGASKRLLDDKKAEWAGVTLLVFAQHVVLAGSVKTAEAKKRVEEVVKRDIRIRSLKNELLTGDAGNLAHDTAIDTEINGALTAAKGVSSVNMRWHTTGGRVVLMGVARSQQEVDFALQKTHAVSGVKAVVSHLRIAAKK